MDRKNVRLVSRLWYDCSTCGYVTKREKFVFRTGFSIESIADVMLRRPNYSQLNLKFQGVSVKSLPIYTWQLCGQRIRTLEFYDCRWNDETIKNIIHHCENLTSFVVKTSLYEAKHNLGKILSAPHLLDGLIEKGIRRPKLHTFTMFIGDGYLSKSVFRKILLIYPGIKHISTGMDSLEKISDHLIAQSGIFSELIEYLSSITELHSLTVNLPTNDDWVKTLIARAEQGLRFVCARDFRYDFVGHPILLSFHNYVCVYRLNHLETMLIYTDSMKDTLFKFFESQKNLKVIRLGIAEAGYQEIKQLTFHILESCPRLEEFCLTTKLCHVELAVSEVSRFVSLISRLKVLSLSFTLSPSPGPSCPALDPSAIHLNLTSLKLGYDEMDIHLCIAILRRCTSLQHLDLARCSDDTLQTIFQYLVSDYENLYVMLGLWFLPFRTKKNDAQPFSNHFRKFL